MPELLLASAVDAQEKIESWLEYQNAENQFSVEEFEKTLLACRQEKEGETIGLGDLKTRIWTFVEGLDLIRLTNYTNIGLALEAIDSTDQYGYEGLRVKQFEFLSLNSKINWMQYSVDFNTFSCLERLDCAKSVECVLKYRIFDSSKKIVTEGEYASLKFEPGQSRVYILAPMSIKDVGTGKCNLEILRSQETIFSQEFETSKFHKDSEIQLN
mgnify:CR=1 FL=1|jgi:hypothetical protein|tara:strand:- start:516 stop:1154 length:639 start_codon:yes stop_codon:yes gene_type:complete